MMLTADRIEMEKKRLLAFDDWVRGVSQAAIGRKYGVSRMSASRWVRLFATKGRVGCRRRKGTGRPPLANRDILAALLGSGGMTAKEASEIIWQTIRVRYHPDHMLRIMKQLGISTRQKRK